MSGHCSECKAVTAHRQPHSDGCSRASLKPGAFVVLDPSAAASGGER